MIQQMKLMALPLPELRARIQEELENNPALEAEYDSPDIYFSQMEDAVPENVRTTDDEYYGDDNDGGISSIIEKTVSEKETLQDYLLFQLRAQKTEKNIADAAELLIQNLDSDGFHIEDPETVTKAGHDITEKAMNLVRMLDPRGTCTWGYRESLLVQAAFVPGAPAEIGTIIENHLEDLEKGRFKETAGRLGISENRTREIFDIIKTLNPYPGRGFGKETAGYIIPDLKILQEEGSIRIYLNNENIPSLMVSPYFEKLSKEKKDGETARFTGSKVREAMNFISMIRMRNETLLRTAQAIAEKQKDFFLNGPRHLVPLTQRELAEEIGMHESTVSRLASEKYVLTDWGTYRLKHFFSTAVQVSTKAEPGGELAKESVKEIIKEIIRENKGGKKLSDQKISDILAEKGITLARRTVGKYRKELDIASSFER